MSRLQPLERGRPLRLLAQHADIDPGVPEVWTGSNSRYGHKSDAWVLQVLRDGLAEHSSHRLVDAAHAPAGHPNLLSRRPGKRAYPDTKISVGVPPRIGSGRDAHSSLEVL